MINGLLGMIKYYSDTRVMEEPCCRSIKKGFCNNKIFLRQGVTFIFTEAFY